MEDNIKLVCIHVSATFDLYWVALTGSRSKPICTGINVLSDVIRVRQYKLLENH